MDQEKINIVLLIEKLIRTITEEDAIITKKRGQLRKKEVLAKGSKLEEINIAINKSLNESYLNDGLVGYLSMLLTNINEITKEKLEKQLEEIIKIREKEKPLEEKIKELKEIYNTKSIANLKGENKQE